MTTKKRVSGILLHISSLPGPYGIGDFGSEAYKFVDFLHETKQKIWQILPLTPTENCSPYSAASAFAGNPLLISPEKLGKMGLLADDDWGLASSFHFDDYYVKFKQVTRFKNELLKRAFRRYKEQQNDQLKQMIDDFRRSELSWLDDYTLYMAIKEKHNTHLWSQWPEELRHRQKDALNQIREQEQNSIEYQVFVQFIFHQQWSELKSYANELGVQIIGDMPVYCDYFSVDVWANSHIFQLDAETLLPTAVSGFPPDDCSAEGQNWNMPIYEWNNEEKKPQVFDWWIRRLKNALKIYDFVRIDHFRGLHSYWSIPVNENFIPLRPVDGHWVEAPGDEFFRAVYNELGDDLPLIVEDLGDMTKEIFALRDKFNLTGIRILQFGFGFYPDNMYLPHNCIQNSVIYTGTHDNPPVVGWWKESALYHEKKNFIEYIKRPEIYDEFGHEYNHLNWMLNHLNYHIHWYFIQMVLASVSNIAIIQLQDILGLDNYSRMNNPALGSNADDDSRQNWSWRFAWHMLEDRSKYKLKLFTHMYYRDEEPKA